MALIKIETRTQYSSMRHGASELQTGVRDKEVAILTDAFRVLKLS